MVTVPLPHLAGLAGAVRVDIDDRVPTMGVFASGRMVANREFVARLKDNELVFVLAHELLHLALRTHDRAKGSGRLEFNYAHDYIINDILRVELGFRRSRRAGSTCREHARSRPRRSCWRSARAAARCARRPRSGKARLIAADRIFGGQQRPGQRGTEDAGLAGDVLGDKLEREWFPADADETGRARPADGGAGGQGARPRQGAGGNEGARHRDRRIDPADVGAARALPHALADGVAEVAGVGCAGRADLRAAVAARQRPQPIWSFPGASARAGCSMCCSIPAAR